MCMLNFFWGGRYNLKVRRYSPNQNFWRYLMVLLILTSKVRPPRRIFRTCRGQMPNSHIFRDGYLYPFTPSSLTFRPPCLYTSLSSNSSLPTPSQAIPCKDSLRVWVRETLRCEIETFEWVHPLFHLKKHLWQAWFIDLHLLLLKLASRRLGITRWVPSSCGALGNVCITPSFVEFLSEHWLSFVVDWVGQVALHDSPPFVRTSTEM
jgi:hypothetical protein